MATDESKARYCPVCGSLLKINNNGLYCCSGCEQYHDNKNSIDEEELASLNQSYDEYKQCVVCGKRVPDNREIFCSDECAKNYAPFVYNPERNWWIIQHKRICSNCN